MNATPNQTAWDVIVVGGGPAGLTAALSAAEAGRRVALLEQLPHPGRKLLATGGGRCNLTRELSVAELMDRFGREGRFAAPAFDALCPQALRDWLGRLGVPTVVENHGGVFPASGKAGDVQRALVTHAQHLGVDIRGGRQVVELGIGAGRVVGVKLSHGQTLSAGRVILACGGRSYPALGGTGGGYALAEQAGHDLVEPTPALVPLVTAERWITELAGLALADARVRILGKRQQRAGQRGAVLFTHRGLSGPAVLDISADVAEQLARGPVSVALNLLPDDSTDWSVRLDEWRRAQGRRPVGNLLREHLPPRLAAALCKAAGAEPATPAAQWPKPAAVTLSAWLKELPLTVTATEGFDKAFVTRGGVRLKGVDPATLASRCVAGLHFAGELLDLDGPCGGFNLQWAFASGRLAGRSAAAAD